MPDRTAEPAHNYGKHPGGRPREEQVPASLGVCPVHGEVEFRSHKVGKDRYGRQRWRRRCPLCHAERALGNTQANL